MPHEVWFPSCDPTYVSAFWIWRLYYLLTLQEQQAILNTAVDMQANYYKESNGRITRGTGP
jgi:hypothetical protein